MGDAEAIVAIGLAASFIMIGLAVAEFIRGADRIALTDGSRTLFASKGQAAWS